MSDSDDVKNRADGPRAHSKPAAPDWDAVARAKGGTLFVTPKGFKPVAASVEPAGSEGAAGGPAGSPDEDPMTFRVIDGRYRVLDRLAVGGMGTVYRAAHLKLNKQVALKLVRAAPEDHVEVLARFDREAKVTALLDHPHIVCAMDYGELPEGGAYLITTLTEGESLGALLSRGALPWAQACQIGGQIADALAKAHGHGVIHRDLKPDNVIVERLADGGLFARVLDFGLARLVEGSSVTDAGEVVTRIGVVIGTPGYMAPEQAIGDDAGVRADLYALGVLLWESVAGRRLWSGADAEELIKQQLTGDAPSVASVASEPLPPELVALVDSLLKKAIDARPADAAQVCGALKRMAQQAAGPSSEHAPFVGAPTMTDADPNLVAGRLIARARPSLAEHLRAIVDGARRELAERKPGRNLAVVGGAALVVLAALVILLVVLLGGGADEPDAEEDDEVEAPVSAADDPVAPKQGSADDVVPDGLEDPIAALIDGRKPAKVKQAITKILAYEPQEDVPAYARLAATIERAQSCKDKKAALLELETLGDPRVLPVLKRMQKTPRDTCGKTFKKRDCLGCLRKELKRTVVALGDESDDA